MAYQDIAPAINRPIAQQYHALLFVGVCNRQRYVLSLNRWANLLHQMYGYPLENIRVLVGTYSNPAWPSILAGTDVTYNATRADLENALAAYAAGSGDPHELGANDNLFIFTFNHGGQDGSGSYLCCENFSTKFYASDFATCISTIHCRQIVLYAAQCRAGGFVDPFINGLDAGTRGAVIAGSRADQDTMEAVSDKLFAAAFNGRMVQNPLDDNIDIGVSGEGMDISLIPGYGTNRIDWGPTGVISTREAFNWVYDHYVNNIYPNPAYASIVEIPLYKQKPWMEAGQPLHIRLGEPDLVMQDNAEDTGDEPSAGTPWYSPDLYADNTDQFPATDIHEYVPAHNNRFFMRTANRGTAPTENVWRVLEVRGLGFTGGPVGPPRIDRAMETVGTESLPARLRPNRAHTQYERILIGGDFGHGCVSAATFTDLDAMNHSLWSIVADNDQVQCNLNPASVSGSFPADSSSVNANGGKIIRKIPVFALQEGDFELQIDKLDKDLPIKIRTKKTKLSLKPGQQDEFVLEIQVTPNTRDGIKAKASVSITCEKKVIGGVTFLVKTATAFAKIFAYDDRGRPIPETKIVLHSPGDPRELSDTTNKMGIASFGPLNPGFYFAEIKDDRSKHNTPTRIYITPGKNNTFRLKS